LQSKCKATFVELVVLIQSKSRVRYRSIIAKLAKYLYCPNYVCTSPELLYSIPPKLLISHDFSILKGLLSDENVYLRVIRIFESDKTPNNSFLGIS
jgi:hypothetical protein